jgi:anti-anti-sigma factor
VNSAEKELVGGFMEAKFYKDGEFTIVALSGRLEIEKTHAFREACMTSLKGHKVIFCMKDLNFVGSTGIQGFFQIIREFNQKSSVKAKIAALKPDFHRLVFVAQGVDLDICESVEGAKAKATVAATFTPSTAEESQLPKAPTKIQWPESF